MACRDSPHLYRCRACHWVKVITDLRDVKIEGYNYFESCPACGSAQIERQPCPSIVTKLTKMVEKYRFDLKK